MSEVGRVESKVRLEPDLAEVLRQIEFKQKITRQQLIVDAIWFYIEKGLGAASQHPVSFGDPALTPKNEHERGLIAAVLAFDRKTKEPQVRKILYVLLDEYLPKGFKK